MTVVVLKRSKCYRENTYRTSYKSPHKPLRNQKNPKPTKTCCCLYQVILSSKNMGMAASSMF